MEERTKKSNPSNRDLLAKLELMSERLDETRQAIGEQRVILDQTGREVGTLQRSVVNLWEGQQELRKGQEELNRRVDDLQEYVAQSFEKSAEVRIELRRELADLRADLTGQIDGVRSELAAVRAELKDEMAAVRVELKDEMAAVRAELKDEMAAVRAELKDEMAAVRVELKDEIAAVRVELGGTRDGLRDDIRSLAHTVGKFVHQYESELQAVNGRIERQTWASAQDLREALSTRYDALERRVAALESNPAGRQITP